MARAKEKIVVDNDNLFLSSLEDIVEHVDFFADTLCTGVSSSHKYNSIETHYLSADGMLDEVDGKHYGLGWRRPVCKHRVEGRQICFKEIGKKLVEDYTERFLKDGCRLSKINGIGVLMDREMSFSDKEEEEQYKKMLNDLTAIMAVKVGYAQCDFIVESLSYDHLGLIVY